MPVGVLRAWRREGGGGQQGRAWEGQAAAICQGCGMWDMAGGLGSGSGLGPRLGSGSGLGMKSGPRLRSGTEPSRCVRRDGLCGRGLCGGVVCVPVFVVGAGSVRAPPHGLHVTWEWE